MPDHQVRALVVDVHLDRLAIAGNQHRLPDLLEVSAQCVDVDRVGRHCLEQEHRLVAEALVGVRDERRRPRPGRIGRRARSAPAALSKVEQRALEEPVQPLAAGIDHACLAQDREERRGAGDGLLGGLDRGGQHRFEVIVALGGRHRAIGRLTDDGQDRAFDRLRDGPVGGLRSLRQRVRQIEPVEATLAGEPFRHPSEDLAGDDPGVAAGTHEGAEADGRSDAVGRLVGDGVGFLEGRLDGRDHVRAGVAVGDGEHVEAVDLVGVDLEVCDRGPKRFQ